MLLRIVTRLFEPPSTSPMAPRSDAPTSSAARAWAERRARLHDLVNETYTADRVTALAHATSRRGAARDRQRRRLASLLGGGTLLGAALALVVRRFRITRPVDSPVHAAK